MTQPGVVREWARQNGFEVAVRGRIAPAIWEAYATEHGTADDPATAHGLWNCGCGREWTGRVEAHCMVCHRHFSTPSNFDLHRPNGHCVDPTTRGLKERKSKFGVIYVGEKEHYRTTEGNGLFDPDED